MMELQVTVLWVTTLKLNV